jgi:shikimate kinase
MKQSFMNSIILTGPKHSGKTSAGKALALLCSCDFIDLDELITQKTGKTPRQLFTEDPSLFKQAEVDVLKAVANKSCLSEPCLCIIATGGGIIDNPEAITILKELGTIVFLSISADTAWSRITGSGELPPFLRTENPQDSHRTLHERRIAAYLQIADAIIETEGKNPEEIADEILQLNLS